MSLYVLDTDHVTLLRKGHAAVASRVAAVPEKDIAVTIITIEEQFRGWFTQVRKARDAENWRAPMRGFSISSTWPSP